MSFDRGRGRGREGRGDRGGYRGRGRGRGHDPGYSGGPSASSIFEAADGLVPPPDAAVTREEDDLQTGENKLQMLSLEQAYPVRPGYGIRGSPIVLWTNYVQMTPPQSLVLYRYDISISPTASGKKANQIIRLLLEAEELISFRQDLVTDFRSTLISREKLPKNDMVVHILYRAEGQDEPQATASQYKVHLKFTNTISMNELTEYLTSTNLTSHYSESLPAIQALNILLKHHSKEEKALATIGASRSFPLSQGAAKWDLGRGLDAIRGFFASVRAATGRILVNVNVSNAAFYRSGPLDGLMDAFGSAGSKYKLEAFLKRVSIQTTHLKERRNKKGDIIPRIKIIHSLASRDDGHGLAHRPRVPAHGAGPKEVQFWLDGQGGSQPSSHQGKGKKKKSKSGPAVPPSSSSGKYISVYDFFDSTYGIKLGRTDLPVVNVGTRESPTYLPPEVCVVVPGQVARTKLDPAQTQAMIRFAVRKPADNARSIVEKGLQTSGLSADTNVLLGRFGVAVSPSFITVPGRVLDEPKVLYRTTPKQTRFGGWNMTDVKFNRAGILRRWSYLLVSVPGIKDAFTQESLGQIVKTFAQALQAVGITVEQPLPGQRLVLNGVDDADAASLDAKLKAASARLDLLLIILPENNTVLYNRIKEFGDVKYGIHTVCLVGSKLAKEAGQNQYMANVALKLNLKLGGSNQLVDDSRLGIICEDKTMVVGIDVTHPSSGSASKAPSVAGMVANIDKLLGQWPAILRIQSVARQEMVSDLEDMLKTRLALWKSRGQHRALPENILVYRDGVSEGQYQTVLDEELPLLRKACERTYPPADQKKGLPRFTIVLVGKRHQTRFYPTRAADADRSSNPKPGTVVDRGVTEARNWDFFLQSHAAIQGTARPAHYFVVIDEIFRQRYKVIPRPYQTVADILQELTQAMCYTFGRATKAVSICTPAYYADILCDRARRYLSGVFDTPTQSVAPSIAGSEQGASASNEDVKIHERLRDSMFYI